MTSHAHAAAYGVLSPQLLEQIVAAHERYCRREPRGQRAVFKFVNLSGVDLSTRCLDDAEFTAAAMVSTRLIRTNLQRASLYGADLSLADLRGADARRADFRGALMRGANLAFARLDEADMRRAVLAIADASGGLRRWRPKLAELPAGSTLHGSSLDSAQLDEADAAGADFSHCSLKNARLNGANFKGADLRGAVMSGAQVRGVILTGATLAGAVLTGVSIDDLRLPPEALKGCVCDPGAAALARRGELLERLEGGKRWAETGGRQGCAPDFDDQDIRVLGPALRSVVLPAMTGRRCLGVGMDFTDAELPGANFEGADLRDATFTGADLRGASFKGANLGFARFDKANLSALELVGGARIEPNLEGANLVGVRFD